MFGIRRTAMDPRVRDWADGLSDEALLEGLASGDADAGLLFTRRFQARVFGAAVTLLGDRALAEDIAQEAFMRAWRHAGAFDPRRGTVAAWLLRITRNLAIDALRLRRPEPCDPGLLSAFDLTAPGQSVDDAVITADLTAQVAAALKQVPVEQSRALVLAAFYGHTAEEISALESIPVGTAKTRIRLGLRKARALLITPSAPLGLTP